MRVGVNRFASWLRGGPMSYVVVTTTTDKQEEAEHIAQVAVERMLVACVQIVGPVESVYRWQGSVERSEEFRCEMKTRAEKFDELKALILQSHLYELPEVIAVPITNVSPAYARWIDEQLGDGE